MFFTRITETTINPEDGRFVDFHLELMPLIKGDDNDRASKAIYAELWHRLRRHRFYLERKNGEECTFSASLYFTNSAVGEDGYISAIVAVNNVKHVKIDYSNAEETARKTLRHMDNLLRCLFLIEDRSSFDDITASLAAGDKSAEARLKDYLKPFCRGKGLFINDNDFYHALSQEKARRRNTPSSR